MGNSTTNQTALVLSASRGLGFALAEEWLRRGWNVIATARGKSDYLAQLAKNYPDMLEIETVDINDADGVRDLRDRVDGRQLDILFVNAGIARAIEKSPATADERDFLDMMLTNAFSPVRAAELLQDLGLSGRTIAIMTFEFGSITNANGGWQLYSSSKAALNMLMRGYAAKNADSSHSLLLVAPSWVRTEMGGSDASLSVDESIPLVVDMIDANRGTPWLRNLDRFSKSLPW